MSFAKTRLYYDIYIYIMELIVGKDSVLPSSHIAQFSVNSQV